MTTKTLIDTDSNQELLSKVVKATGSSTARLLADRFGEVFNVKDYGALGDNSTDDGTAISAALSAAVSAGGGTIYFPPGTYCYATSPNFALQGVNILADRGALFKHTGTGNAFILDAGAAGAIFGNRYENITVQGNSNSTNGMYVRSVHKSVFVLPKILAAATTGSGILIEFCILNEWHTPTVSVNGASSIPLHGMYLTRRGSGLEHTTTQLITNPIMEGLTNSGGYGIVIDYAGANVILNGTSEGNNNGLRITVNGVGSNHVAAIDFEANTTNDLLVEGHHNTFVNLEAGTLLLLKGSGARYNHFLGGNVNAITLDATGGAPAYNIFRGTAYANNGGAFTDGGTNTIRDYLINITGAYIERSDIPSSFTDADTTPSVILSKIFTVTNTNPTTITTFDDGISGQEITLIFTNGNTTIAETGNIKLSAAFTSSADDTMKLIFNGTNWYELSRSVN